MSQNPIRNVCVLGLGYIGLPTAAVIASRGIHVVGVDVKKEVVDKINSGEIHIVEPDLDAVTAQAVRVGNLRASLTVEPADAFVVAVPTPFHDGHADLSYVWSAARAIAPQLREGSLVVLESTSPPGTTEKLVRLLANERPDLSFPGIGYGATCDVFVAYCPERVLPGRVLVELVENSRVIGGVTSECAERARLLYEIFCQGGLVTTDVRTAEMCKLVENAYRDVNIAFANELSLVCDKLDINVWELISIANRHPRVNILQPGPGVGGHCIAVDPWFIVEAAPEQSLLIRTARNVNDGKPGYVIDKIATASQAVAAGGKKPVIGILGLAFKPDVDDLRESPALAIATAVAQWNDVDVLVSEPYIDSLPEPLSSSPVVTFVQDADAVVAAADIVVMLVNHRSFLSVPSSVLARKTLIDTRGVWS